MCRQSSFHLHRVIYDLREQGKVDTHQIRELLDMMRSDDAAIHAIIAGRTRIPPHEVERMLREGAVIDPDAALAQGIIDEIREVDVPEGARFVQLAFRRPG
jgi:ATP-dependent protease ClpP protease subunit